MAPVQNSTRQPWSAGGISTRKARSRPARRGCPGAAGHRTPVEGARSGDGFIDRDLRARRHRTRTCRYWRTGTRDQACGEARIVHPWRVTAGHDAHHRLRERGAKSRATATPPNGSTSPQTNRTGAGPRTLGLREQDARVDAVDRRQEQASELEVVPLGRGRPEQRRIHLDRLVADPSAVERGPETDTRKMPRTVAAVAGSRASTSPASGARAQSHQRGQARHGRPCAPAELDDGADARRVGEGGAEREPAAERGGHQ